MASFNALEELGDSPYAASMKADLAEFDERPWAMSPEACRRLLGFAAEKVHLGGEALRQAIEAKAIEYDPISARKCVTALSGEGLAMCRTKTSPRKAEPGGVSLEELSRRLESALPDLNACGQVIVGRRGEDEFCEAFECAPGLSCDIWPEDTTLKVCRKAEQGWQVGSR